MGRVECEVTTLTPSRVTSSYVLALPHVESRVLMPELHLTTRTTPPPFFLTYLPPHLSTHQSLFSRVLSSLYHYLISMVFPTTAFFIYFTRDVDIKKGVSGEGIRCMYCMVGVNWILWFICQVVFVAPYWPPLYIPVLPHPPAFLVFPPPILQPPCPLSPLLQFTPVPSAPVSPGPQSLLPISIPPG